MRIRGLGAVLGGVNAASSTLDALPRLPARAGFAEVAAEQLDAVYAYLVYLTGDRSAAEDLAAETFEKAFRTWRRFDPRRGTPRTWLCRIARSVAIDWFRAEQRRRRREETYAREVVTEVGDVFGDALPGPLDQALRELSPGERDRDRHDDEHEAVATARRGRELRDAGAQMLRRARRVRLQQGLDVNRRHRESSLRVVAGRGSAEWSTRSG